MAGENRKVIILYIGGILLGVVGGFTIAMGIWGIQEVAGSSTKTVLPAVPACGVGSLRVAANRPCEPANIKAAESAGLPPGQYCYQVSAVNAAGESSPSNEICVTVPKVPLSAFQKFVTDVQASTPYATWKAANVGDYNKWVTFRNEILNGQKPAPPAMSGRFGKALVDVGVIYLEALQ